MYSIKAAIVKIIIINPNMLKKKGSFGSWIIFSITLKGTITASKNIIMSKGNIGTLVNLIYV